MSALIFLTTDDFSVQKSPSGDILCNSIQGFSLVLFYSTKCEHCQELIPIFKGLPGTLANCQFAMINVSQQRGVAEMSRSTISPITYVPYIVLYVNGRTFMKYNGPTDSNEIKRFVIEVTRNLQNKQKFYEETTQKHEKEHKIPEYTTGVPKTCGDNVC